MKISDAMKVLRKSDSENIFNLYVVTEKKMYPFKNMTVGQRKSISKVAIDTNDTTFDIDFHLMYLGVLQELCIDDTFNVSNLTDVDFIVLVADLRRNIIMDDLTITSTCPKCNAKTNFRLEFNKIVESGKNYEPVHFEMVKMINGKSVKFLIDDPLITTYLSYLNYIQVHKTSPKLAELVDIGKLKVMNYPLQFLRDIMIDDEKVSDFNEMNFAKKVKFIDDTFDSEIMYGKDGVFTKIYNDVPDNRVSKLYPLIKCSKCPYERESVVTFDNFFSF